MEALWKLAERQHALVRRDQGVALLGERRYERLVAAGRLVSAGSGVCRVPGSPRSAEQRLLAAVWAAGASAAVASGRSAAWLYGLVDVPPGVPEVMVPAGRYRRTDTVRLVQSIDLTPMAATVRHGIPTLKPMLTMVELARVLDRDGLADALERGLGLFPMAAMWRVLDRYGRSGRNGIGLLREVVTHRALEERPSDSEVEERSAQLLVAEGLTGWTYHHVVRDRDGKTVAEPDLAFVLLRMGFEVDGALKFRERGYLDRFTERRHRLRALGWDIEHFTWTQVVRRPQYFRATVRRCVAARCAELGVPAELFSA